MAWGTAKELLEAQAATVQFEREEATEDSAQPTLAQALKRRRGQYLEELGLRAVTRL